MTTVSGATQPFQMNIPEVSPLAETGGLAPQEGSVTPTYETGGLEPQEEPVGGCCSSCGNCTPQLAEAYLNGGTEGITEQIEAQVGNDVSSILNQIDLAQTTLSEISFDTSEEKVKAANDSQTLSTWAALLVTQQEAGQTISNPYALI